MTRNLVVLSSIFFLMLLPAIAMAERSASLDWSSQNRVSPPQQAYGTTDWTTVALNPFAFEPRTQVDHSAMFVFDDIERYCNTDCTLIAPVNIPSGANINFIELYAYDGDLSGQVTSDLLRCPASFSASSCSVLASASTTVEDNSGYQFPNQQLAHTADNFNNTYAVRVTITGGFDSTALVGYRVYYNLQVSPAPVSATFPDVGTGHWAFQYVEALVSTGVISGKPDGLFHPADPITRAEISKLIAVLLGVHWPDL